MTLSSGTRLGPYEITAPLGAGGMGEVYRARDTRLERSVALKVLPQELSQDADLKARFTREAKAISALAHPHICALYDVGSEDGLDYLVMELLEGETLADRIAKGPLPTEQVLRIGKEIAEALDRAHRQGVVHRDLKPGNVMLTRSGVKLLDFGLAKLRETDVEPALSHLPTRLASKPLTEKGTVLGTFQYMSPEQLEGKDVDARSDIFALGAVLYETSTGRKAFSGTSQASLIAAILSSEPPPISTIQKMSPPALDRLVKTCLAKDPDERWQSAHDVAAELKWIAEGGSQVGAPAAVVSKRKSRERLAWALAALLAAALAAALLLPRRPTPPGEAVRASILLPDNALFENAVTVPEISPDGRAVAFSSNYAHDPSPIWILSLGSDDARPLAGTEHASFAFFSPDGRSLGFFADAKLKRIDLAGGSPVTICDVEEPEARGGAWGPDGTILFAGGRKSPILRVPASGGAPVPVTTIDRKRGDNSHRWPRFLPDGQRFLFWATPNVGDSSHEALFASSLDGRAPRLVLEGVSNGVVAGGHVLFMRHTFARDNRLYARRIDLSSLQPRGEPVPVAERVGAGYGVARAMFAASDRVLVYLEQRSTTPVQAVFVDRQGARTGTLGEPARIETARLSPDGRSVALEIVDPDARMPAIFLSDAAGTRRTRVSFGAVASFSPVWSPDGKRVAFISCKGPTDCWIAARDASGAGNEERLLSGELVNNGGLEDWSPDGTQIVYSRWNAVAGNGDVWALPLTGDRKPHPLLDSPADEGTPRFSRDGRFLAYESNETGRFEVFVKSVNGPGKWQVSTEGGISPRWRGDGKELFFESRDRRLLSVSVTATPAFEASTPRSALERRLGNVFNYYDVVPSGDRFLMEDPPPDAKRPRLRIVSNWQALLAR